MPSTSFALALSLIAAGISLEASAYPGAKATDLEKMVEIKSICRAENSATHETFMLGYTTPAAAPQNGRCPPLFSVLLRSFPVERISTPEAEKTGNTVFHWIASRHELRKGKNYSMEHQVAFYESGHMSLVQNMGEAQMTQNQAQLALATAENPVSVTVNYGAKTITDLKRASTTAERTLNIVAICESDGNLYGYSKDGFPRTARDCPAPYQFKLFGIGNEAPMGWFNYIDEFRGPMVNSFFVEISSQFGLPLFSTNISGASFTKARRDFITASPAHPVKVTVDEKAQTVISITPSISPYAL